MHIVGPKYHIPDLHPLNHHLLENLPSKFQRF